MLNSDLRTSDGLLGCIASSVFWRRHNLITPMVDFSTHSRQSIAAFHLNFRMDSNNMRDTPAPASSGQTGWEWKSHTEKWVASSGKPHFRVVPDDTKPTLRDPLSTSDPTETEHFILRPPPFSK